MTTIPITAFMKPASGLESLATSPPENAPLRSHIAFKDIAQSISHDFKGTGVSVMITFTDVWLKQYRPSHLFELTMNEIRRFTNKKEETQKFFFRGEYSKIGWFHIHGILEDVPGSYVNKFKTRLHHFGIVSVKAISYFDSYVIYMLKNDKHGYEGYDENVRISKKYIDGNTTSIKLLLQ